MIAVNWEPEFNTGIEIIDTQHRKIFAMINHLSNTSSDSEQNVVTSVLKQMREYVAEHFKFEEELMRTSEYPYTEVHIKLHGRFLLRLDDLTQRHQRGEEVLTDMAEFLTRWLIHHIGHEDQDYVPDVKRVLHEICS